MGFIVLTFLHKVLADNEIQPEDLREFSQFIDIQSELSLCFGLFY